MGFMLHVILHCCAHALHAPRIVDCGTIAEHDCNEMPCKKKKVALIFMEASRLCVAVNSEMKHAASSSLTTISAYRHVTE